MLFLLLFSVVRAQPLNPSQEAQDFTVAYGLFKDGQYQLALEEFERFLDRRPSSTRRPDAAFLVAECLMHLGKSDQARDQYERFISDHPSSPLSGDARFRIAELFFAEEKWTEAIDRFRAGASHRSDLAGDAHYWIGESFFKLGRHDSALVSYRRSFDAAPAVGLADYALYSIGWVHQQDRNYAAALQAYEDLERRFPGRPLAVTASIRKAEMELEAGRQGGALQALRTQRARFTSAEDLAEATYLLGEAAYRRGEYKQAAAWYDSFMVCCSGHRLARDVQYSKAWVLLQTKKYAEAAEAFVRISEGSDAVAHASLYRAGVAWKLAGRRSEAESLFRRVASVRESAFADDGLYEIAALRHEAGAYDSARALLHTLLAAYPVGDARGRSLFLMGETFRAEGKDEEALAAYSDALRQEGVTEEVRADVIFEKGLVLSRLKRHTEAVDEFRRFTVRFPDDPQAGDAYFWLGESAFQNGDYRLADSAYAAALGRVSGDRIADVLYGRAWAKFRLGEFQAARLLFDRLAAQYPASRYAADARIRSADCAYSLRDYQKAVAAYRDILRRSPDAQGTDYVRFQLAGALVRAGSATQGIEEYTTLLARHPRSEYADDARYAMGWVYFQRKQYPRAIALFREALAASPNSELAPRILCSLGDAEYNSGNYPAAAESYREVLRKHPDAETVTDALKGVRDAYAAMHRESEGDTIVSDFLNRNTASRVADRVLFQQAEEAGSNANWDEALQLYASLVDRYSASPLVPAAALGAGKAASVLGRSQDGERWFRMALDRSPAGEAAPGALLGLGRLMMTQQRYREAQGFLEQAIQREGKGNEGLEAALELGRVQLALNDTTGALARFETIASGADDTRQRDAALIEAARILGERGAVDRAVAYFSKAAKNRSDDLGAEAQTRIGELFLRRGMPKDAVAALARVRYLYPGSPSWIARATVGMAEGYLQLNESARSRALYQSVLEEFPDSPSAAEARTRLKELQ